MSEDVTSSLYHRLDQLGFPFGDPSRVAAWAVENVNAGRIARISQTELMMNGVPVYEIARRTGISVARVYYHITRPVDDFGDPEEGWAVA